MNDAHPFALSDDDKAALAEAKRISYADAGALSSPKWREPFTVPAALFDRVEDILHRMPTYKPLTGSDGEFVRDDDGHIQLDYTKPSTQGFAWCDANETRPHVKYTGRVMLRGE